MIRHMAVVPGVCQGDEKLKAVVLTMHRFLRYPGVVCYRKSLVPTGT